MGPGGTDPVPGEHYTKVNGHGYVYPRIQLNLNQFTPKTTTPGTWHACVFEADDANIPTTYPGDLNPATGILGLCGTGCGFDKDYVAECPFIVSPYGIPEFPAASAPVAVVGLCGVIYVWLRKRREAAQAA
jgi:hypothetical protein